MLFKVFQSSIAVVFIITVSEINEHLVSADLGELLATKDGEGGQEGLLGQNLSGTFGGILKKGDDLSKAAKNAAFFGNLDKLIYNILTDSPDVAANTYLARALVNQIRGGGFCGLKPGNSYAVAFAGLVNN